MRKASINTLLTVVSLLVGFVVLEAATRITQRVPLWRYPNYITGPRADAGAVLPTQYDARLGWLPGANYTGTGRFEAVMYTGSADSLRQHNRDRPTPPADGTIVAVGDSFTEGAAVEDDAAWPAHLERLVGRRVLNGGVSGYGIDQAVLRAEDLVAKYKPSLLLVGFIPEDIDRAEFDRHFGGAKPYFSVEGGALVLRNVPVPPPELVRLELGRRVLGHFFLVDLLMRRLDRLDYWYAGVRGEHRAHHDGERVACLLMQRLAALPTRTILVAQYTPGIWMNEAARREHRRRVAQVAACARDARLDLIDTFDGVAQAVAKDGVAPYYIDWHMNDAGNALTAKLIAAHLQTVR